MDPLAIKMRPKSIKEVIGQTQLIGKDKVLSNLVKNKKLTVNGKIYKSVLIVTV